MTVQDLIKTIRDDQKAAILGQYGDITPKELFDKLVADTRVNVKDFWHNDYFLPSPDEKQLIDAINEAVRLYSKYLHDGKPSISY